MAAGDVLRKSESPVSGSNDGSSALSALDSSSCSTASLQRRCLVITRCGRIVRLLAPTLRFGVKRSWQRGQQRVHFRF